MKSLFLKVIETLMTVYEKLYVKDKEVSRTLENLMLKKNLYMKRVKQVHRVIMEYANDNIPDKVIEYEEDTGWIDMFPGVQIRMVSFEHIFINKEVSLTQMKEDSEIPLHKHSQSTEEVYVISGEILDTITGLKTSGGESYFIPAGSPHNMVAVRDTVMIVTYTGK